MNAKEYNNLMVMLAEIRDRMPVRDISNDPAPFSARKFTDEVNGTPDRLVQDTVLNDIMRARRNGARKALATMHEGLNGWVRGAKENHEVMDHSGENRGSECWRTFAPSDFRNMINDAARELGVDEFPLPEVPEEDKPCE